MIRYARSPMHLFGLVGLVLGSGGATHNLALYAHARGRDDDSAPPEWVEAFNEWTAGAVAARRFDDLFRYSERAPYAAQNHPTPEHYLPLFVTLGASHDAWLAVLGDDCDGRGTLASLLYGVLPPSSGRVELDGSDIRNLSLDELRSDVALVAQANLVDGSVADNLSWGQPLDAGRAARVLELLDLTDVLGRLPDGLMTSISGSDHPLTAASVAAIKPSAIL